MSSLLVVHLDAHSIINGIIYVMLTDHVLAEHLLILNYAARKNVCFVSLMLDHGLSLSLRVHWAHLVLI
jgi:hypothetical protein